MWWKIFKYFSPKNLEKISEPKPYLDRNTEYFLFILIFRLLAKIRTQRNARSNVFLWKLMEIFREYVATYAHIFVARIFWQRNYILSESLGGGWGGGASNLGSVPC
jgi:hypothetical protein